LKNTVTIHDIKPLIGEEAVQKLVDAYPGKLLYLPKKPLDFPDQEAKEKYIVNCYHSGMSKDDIANAVGLSADRVSKIIYKRYKDTK